MASRPLARVNSLCLLGQTTASSLGLAGLPQPGAWPPPRPARSCLPGAVGTKGPRSLSPGKEPVVSRRPVAEIVSGALACLLGDTGPAQVGVEGVTPASVRGGSEMQCGGGVSTWSWLHRLQLFQMCRGSRCGDDSARSGEGWAVHVGGMTSRGK